MRILEGHAFRLPVRRFILDLFDRSVMRRVVLDDDDDEDDSENEDEQDGESKNN